MKQTAWIERTEALADWLDAHTEGPLALDTEADSLHRYPEKVCLIQLSAGGDDALLDPLAGLDPSALRETLENPHRQKILHGADYDIRMLDRDFGLRIRGLFDTMIAARFVGEQAFGLAALLDAHLGVKLDKKFQRADWSRRPLSPEMRLYAILDTRHLEELHGLLSSRLGELGREEWAQEEFERLEALRWTGGPDPEAYRRIKGSPKLASRELAALREYFGLRETIARRKDRPPFKILPNPVLIELAKQVENDSPDWGAVEGLPRRWADGDARRELIEAWNKARAIPEADLPERLRGRRKRIEPEVETVLQALAKGRDKVAEDLELEPSLIAARATLEAMATAHLAGGDPREVPALRRWQAGLMGPTLDRL